MLPIQSDTLVHCVYQLKPHAGKKKVVIYSQGKNLNFYTGAFRAVCEYRQFGLDAKASKNPVGKLRCKQLAVYEKNGK